MAVTDRPLYSFLLLQDKGIKNYASVLYAQRRIAVYLSKSNARFPSALKSNGAGSLSIMKFGSFLTCS